MVVLTDALHDHFDVRYSDEMIALVNTMREEDFFYIFEQSLERYIDCRVAKNPKMLWAKKGWLNRSQRLFTLLDNGRE
jgi:hypothetical protein